ncbi:MAG: MBL fold metallo-hydrolase [Bacteroidota bacterium]
MAHVASLTFNPFQENTYIVYDDTKECIIFDPGCYTDQEKQQLQNKIAALGLTPVRLINTHCHIDHVFGNSFVADTYSLGLEIHREELPLLKAVPQQSYMFGVPIKEDLPEPSRFIEVGETIQFGNTTLQTLFTPGHSPASISFYCEADAFVIAGDVLFYESIGRTDLPGGNHKTLIESIQTQLMVLDDKVTVYSGHGPSTTIGHERRHNPFF